MDSLQNGEMDLWGREHTSPDFRPSTFIAKYVSFPDELSSCSLKQSTRCPECTEHVGRILHREMTEEEEANRKRQADKLLWKYPR